MKLQAAADRAWRRKLNGNFFALFGDLIDAVAYVRDVKLKIQVPRLGSPKLQPARQVGRKVLRQPGAVFDDGAAAVAHRASRPESPPAVVVKNLRGARVRLVER